MWFVTYLLDSSFYAPLIVFSSWDREPASDEGGRNSGKADNHIIPPSGHNGLQVSL